MFSDFEFTRDKFNAYAGLRGNFSKSIDYRIKVSAHFMEKGQIEMPFVENRYKVILAKEGEDAANDFLTGYTADFAGAAMLRWKEMGDSFWTQFERGF